MHLPNGCSGRERNRDPESDNERHQRKFWAHDAASISLSPPAWHMGNRGVD